MKARWLLNTDKRSSKLNMINKLILPKVVISTSILKTKMKNIISFITKIYLVSMCLAANCNAEIYSASSLSEIKNNILEILAKREPSKTLLIVPVEDFLLQSTNPEFQLQDKNLIDVTNKIYQKAKLSRIDYVAELKLTEYPQQLADKQIPEFIGAIQEHNAPIIAVTKNVTGSFNKIPYLEVWTWNLIKKQGIDLSKSPIGSKQIIFNKTHKKLNGTYPTLYRGLLSCNSKDNMNSRQSVLGALFALELNSSPEVIFIIDKEENYIESIEQQFKLLRPDILVIGFIYKPMPEISNKVSVKDLVAFSENFVNKLNKVSRQEKGAIEENPYEK